MPTPRVAPSGLYTIEQVQQLLNKQKEEFTRKSSPVQMSTPIVSRKAAPQYVVMSKEEFQKKFAGNMDGSMSASLLDEESNSTPSMRLTNVNMMQ
jgi:hypothetical protein